MLNLGFGICSYIISWGLHEASTLVDGHRVYGDGIFVLYHTYEWAENQA